MTDHRKQFFEEMDKLATLDEDIILIVGDLGYSFMEGYAEKHPKQFLNAGCMEQSMVGIACGMALMGKKPYVYSNGIFLIMRAYEQVRDDVAYNNLNVKLICTGASGFLGFSHNLGFRESIENLIRPLPNIDCIDANESLGDQLLLDGPLCILL